MAIAASSAPRSRGRRPISASFRRRECRHDEVAKRGYPCGDVLARRINDIKARAAGVPLREDPDDAAACFVAGGVDVRKEADSCSGHNHGPHEEEIVSSDPPPHRDASLAAGATERPG